MKLLFIGPPGAGKGTQADLLKDKNFYKLSTGDLIRESDDPVILRYKSNIDKGSFLPDSEIIRLIKAGIQKMPAQSRGYILDGAIRTIPQAKFALLNSLIDAVLYFDLSEKEARKRIEERRKKENRKDDEPESVNKRFIIYKNETLPTLNFLKDYLPLKCYKIDASYSKEKIHERIVQLLEL